MNKQRIFDELAGMMTNINDQLYQIKNHVSTAPQHEIDLFIQNMRKAYEYALMLHYKNALESLDNTELLIMERLQAERLALEAKLSSIRTAVNDDLASAAKSHSENDHMPKANELTEPAVAAIEAEHGVESQTSSEEKLIKAVADRFAEATTLHDVLSKKQSSSSVAGAMQAKPITDLKAAIGINEKFHFVNKLFAGNMQQYHDTVERINKMADARNDKSKVIRSLLEEFSWSKQDVHAALFIELVERRFF